MEEYLMRFTGGKKSRKEFFNEILDVLTLLGGDVGDVK